MQRRTSLKSFQLYRSHQDKNGIRCSGFTDWILSRHRTLVLISRIQIHAITRTWTNFLSMPCRFAWSFTNSEALQAKDRAFISPLQCQCSRYDLSLFSHEVFIQHCTSSDRSCLWYMFPWQIQHNFRDSWVANYIQQPRDWSFTLATRLKVSCTVYSLFLFPSSTNKTDSDSRILSKFFLYGFQLLIKKIITLLFFNIHSHLWINLGLLKHLTSLHHLE